MCAQELAPSRSGLQWMLRKFKFKIKQKKRQEYCLKKNPRSHFIGEKERIRVGIDSGSGSGSWSLWISLPLTLNGEGSRRGPAGRAWTKQAGVLRLHPGRLQSLPHTPSILSALLGTKSNPPGAREGGAELC